MHVGDLIMWLTHFLMDLILELIVILLRQYCQSNISEIQVDLISLS